MIIHLFIYLLMLKNIQFETLKQIQEYFILTQHNVEDYKKYEKDIVNLFNTGEINFNIDSSAYFNYICMYYKYVMKDYDRMEKLISPVLNKFTMSFSYFL